MEYNHHIIIVPLDSMSEGRIALERISGGNFQDREAVLNAFCFNENDPCAVEDVKILTLHEFCNFFNDEEFSTQSNWIGEVKIAVQVQKATTANSGIITLTAAEKNSTESITNSFAFLATSPDAFICQVSEWLDSLPYASYELVCEDDIDALPVSIQEKLNEMGVSN